MGSLGATGFKGIAGAFAESAVGKIGFGALAGGIGAAATGGNFWKGTVIGGIVAGLNDVLHQMLDGSGDEYKDNNRNPKQDKPLSKGEIKKLKESGWSQR